MNNILHNFQLSLRKQIFLPLILLWILLSIPVLILAHFYPLTHYGYNYYGIAYSMWVKHIFWYPVWQDTINVQKAPLFYWLTHFFWYLFGVHALFMPFIILVCYLFIAILSAKICLIFSNNRETARIAGILVLINLTFLYYVTFIRFDIQLTLCFLLAFYAICQISYRQKCNYGFLYSLAILLGILFKGPVILLFVLPAAILGLMIFPTQITSKNAIRYLLSIIFFTCLALLASLLWLIPANIHSHGIYLQTILAQTAQRFNHTNPDPNVPQLPAIPYHWWYVFGYFFYYVYSVFFAPFIFILPIFAIRIFYGYRRQLRQTFTHYLFYSMMIPIIFFAAFVGLVRSRYVLPLIPLNCILIAYLANPIILSVKAKRWETLIYKISLIVLLIFAVICISLSFIPKLEPLSILLILLGITGFIIFAFGFRPFDFRMRLQRLVIAISSMVYLFTFLVFIYLHHYPTITKGSEKLQQLTKQHQPILEINFDITREGWTQFVARNLKIKVYTAQNFNDLKFVNKNDNKPLWIVYSTSITQIKPFINQIYPLQYSLKPNAKVPILMPYSIFLKLNPQP